MLRCTLRLRAVGRVCREGKLAREIEQTHSDAYCSSRSSRRISSMSRTAARPEISALAQVSSSACSLAMLARLVSDL
jgi:hypothetical protein